MKFLFLQNKSKHIRGFTLVETVMTVAIYTLVIFAIFQSVTAFYTYNAYAIAQSYQVNTARHGMEILVRDIREMTYADDGTFPLAIMEPNKVGFFSDVDRDNSVEYIEYELLTTLLEKRIYNAVGNPPVYETAPDETHILSEYVQNVGQGIPTFTYYDKNGAIATSGTTVTDIVYIEAQIIVNVDPVRDPGEFMLRSSAALRNLKETN
jgi:Tfp pilus assembly protein PilW